MKKQLRFLYRYIFASRRWRRWINTHTVMATFVSLVFFTTLAWSAPYPAERPHSLAEQKNTAVAGADANIAMSSALQQTATVDSTNLPTRTPFPPEFETNSDQTLGVTLAGAALVLIVLVGVLSFLPRKDMEEKG